MITNSFCKEFTSGLIHPEGHSFPSAKGLYSLTPLCQELILYLFPPYNLKYIEKDGVWGDPLTL